MTAGETGSGPATALALASVRIIRGNPSLDEVAALATVLAARAQAQAHAQAHAQSTGHRTDRPGPNGAEAAARTRWEHLAGTFRAPGAWAS
ncbi:acyl-CoA carboxylase epsilon subunit [Streptomyces sp. NPDC059849]|uniref:acyl-CoA carboxylase epsilon subunit n=1 Tax=Streptomyces sp. NPDC059849 TaxID=3346969 RepID=UPI00365B9686